MNISEKRKSYESQLYINFKLLEKSLDALSYSYEKCKGLQTQPEYTPDEQESFEALTARFARSSDILTQKVLKSLFFMLQENIRTIIDAANLLEKLEIIETADDLLNIRELRNQIAHEYQESELKELFIDVLRYSPKLNTITGTLKKYIQNTFPGGV